jgi:hypothetical protein
VDLKPSTRRASQVIHSFGGGSNARWRGPAATMSLRSPGALPPGGLVSLPVGIVRFREVSPTCQFGFDGVPNSPSIPRNGMSMKAYAACLVFRPKSEDFVEAAHLDGDILRCLPNEGSELCSCRVHRASCKASNLRYGPVPSIAVSHTRPALVCRWECHGRQSSTG